MPKTTLGLLPTWVECDQQINQLGKPGVSALMFFIHAEEPVNTKQKKEFRERLAAMIDEVAGRAVQRHYEEKK